MKKKFYMCVPESFDVRWRLSTNKWMDPAKRPDSMIAARQWLSLYFSARDAAEVGLMEDTSLKLPDQVFFANAGLPYKDLFIMSNFYHAERQGENELNLRFFKKRFAPENIFLLSGDAYFEGQGDAVWLDEKTLAIGYGIRTNLKGVKQVEQVLHGFDPDIRVIPLRMEEQNTFYHLDTCFLHCPEKNSFLIWPYAFTEEARREIAGLGRVVFAGELDAENFVCNSVPMNSRVIFTPVKSEGSAVYFKECGYTDIRVFPMSEFLKSGGAAKCLMLEHNFPIA